jgi:uncharacterized membrane protein
VITNSTCCASIILGAFYLVIARPTSCRDSTAVNKCFKLVAFFFERQFYTHVIVSAVVVVVAGLVCCQGASAACTGVEEEKRGDCHTLVIYAAIVVIVAGLSNGYISQAKRHICATECYQPAPAEPFFSRRLTIA